MPIIDIEPQGITAPLGRATAVTPGLDEINHGSDTPDFGTTLGAAFRHDNIVGAARSAFDIDMPRERDVGFNTWEALTEDERKNWDRYTDVFNPRALVMRRQQILNERENQRILEASPWYYSVPSQLLAGGLDLPSLLPGGAFYRSAKGGFSLGKSAASVGTAAGVGTAAQEAALHGIQSTRTAEESAINIGASVLLGGLLGSGGASLLSRGEWRAAVEGLERGVGAVEAIPGAHSAGASANAPQDIEGNTIAGRAAQAVAGAEESLNPNLRALQSPSAAWREIGQQLFENPIYLKKNFDGVASDVAVETLMKEWNAGLVKGIQSSAEAWSEHRKAGGQMTRTAFMEQVGKAMRRGDADADPAVAAAAKEWRSQVFDPLKDAAIKAGLLPEDVSVDTAASYFTRMWNRNKLIADEAGFKNRVIAWVEQNAPEWAKQFDQKSERSLNPLRREIADEEIAKLRRAEELKQRDNEIDAGEFSESDIRSALRIVQGGAPRPKGVETLTQFIARAGGLVDFSGELNSSGITNKARPGFIRTIRKRAQSDGGGWAIDDMAGHAWEQGFFPDHVNRPSVNEFLNALHDDFFKTRAVVRQGDRDAFRLQELVHQLEQDLARVGVMDTKGPRFSTSDEVKGIVKRVFAAMDAEADRKIAALKSKLKERETIFRQERDSRFLGDPKEMGRGIADEVFNTLTGKVSDATRPELMPIKARGPLKERTFHIPDELIEDFLEHDVERVARRYTRVMGADVEMANKFGSPDMLEQIGRIRENYKALRAEQLDDEGRRLLGLRKGATAAEKQKALDAAEKRDINDLEAVRDILRGTYHGDRFEGNYGRIVRAANHINYIRSMGEVVLASLTDAVRPAMVHGLGQFMRTIPQLVGNLDGIKLQLNEAKLAGNVSERVLGHRLASMSDIMDPFSARSPFEATLENLTNVASKWNGIRLWTDWMKSVASVMTQDRILKNVEGFGATSAKEKRYLAFLGVDESMAGRIAGQFAKHGETVDGARVANTEKWDDPVARRTFRAALNKDIDSIIVEGGVADVPLFAHTPTGKALLQFKKFALASNQRVLLRGLQEDQSRFIGGVVAMTTIGMFITWTKGLTGNRNEVQDKALKNPGWWVGEGFDRSGILSVPMELSNIFEKATGVNPIKAPLKAFDDQGAISQRNQNRSLIGAIAGPSAGLIDDAATASGIPMQLAKGEEVTKGQRGAVERLIPFNSYFGVRQFLRYIANPEH